MLNQSNVVIDARYARPNYVMTFDCDIIYNKLEKRFRYRFLWIKECDAKLTSIQMGKLSKKRKMNKIVSHIQKYWIDYLDKNYKGDGNIANYSYDPIDDTLQLLGVIYPKLQNKTHEKRKNLRTRLNGSRCKKFKLFGQPNNLFVYNKNTYNKLSNVNKKSWFKSSSIEKPEPIDIDTSDKPIKPSSKQLYETIVISDTESEYINENGYDIGASFIVPDEDCVRYQKKRKL